MLRHLAPVLFALFASIPGLAHAQGLTGFLSPGPLAEPHAEYDTLSQCSACHAAGRGVSAAKCLECHDTVAGQVRSGRGFHADKGEGCETCHLDHRGRAFDMVQFEETDFDHTATGFPLRGAHGDAGCTDCHTSGDWGGLQQTCESCHDDPHGVAESSGALVQGCPACHTESSWEALPLPTRIFDHGRADHTAFALEGAHADVACESCHDGWRFVPTAHDACTTCHDDPHRAPFSDDCSSCHTVRADWRVPGFDHARTGYVLEGVHADVSCRSCHGGDVTRPVPHEACATCHDDPHGGQFAPRTCDSCHSVEVPGFAMTDFDHAAVGWPLVGEHAAVTCADCHGSGADAVYVDTPTGCASCHDDPHEGRFAPAGCESCHSPIGWRVEDFDHARTDFPLTGAHAAVACESCHASGYAGVAHDSCLDCHAGDDPHDDTVAAGTCVDCHVTDRWATLTFDHAVTAFGLAPQHTEAVCGDCHGPERFVGLEPVCAACHEPPPDHYGEACGDCHRGADWLPADLGPLGHAVTGFALHGTHERLDCVSCHAPSAPKGVVETSCVGCHAADDVHRNMLGNACGDCHTERTWVRTRWRHQLTGWPLRGAHRLAACDDCHAVGYVGTPSECFRCHESEAPMDVPSHQSPFFADCGACHKPYTWATPSYTH